MYFRRLLSIAVSALMAAPSFALASPSSTLNGLITSAQGKPLARLSLDLLNLDTGRVTVAQTDGTGAFRVTLDPGLYTVDAGRSGYRVERGPQVVKLVAGQAMVANLALANTAAAAAMPAVAMMMQGDQKVAVSGEVQGAGSFAYAPGMTVRQAIALAGGMTSDAATDSVTIIRNGVELAGQLDDPLQPGDKVVVRKKGSKGAVVAAGTAAVVAGGAAAAGLSTAAIVAIAAAAIGVTATAVVIANNSSPSAPPVTQPPATNPPATNPPATNPPATNPPATNPPATNPPGTNPPPTTLPPSGSVSR